MRCAAFLFQLQYLFLNLCLSLWKQIFLRHFCVWCLFFLFGNAETTTLEILNGMRGREVSFIKTFPTSSHKSSTKIASPQRWVQAKEIQHIDDVEFKNKTKQKPALSVNKNQQLSGGESWSIMLYMRKWKLGFMIRLCRFIYLRTYKYMHLCTHQCVFYFYPINLCQH